MKYRGQNTKIKNNINNGQTAGTSSRNAVTTGKLKITES